MDWLLGIYFLGLVTSFIAVGIVLVVKPLMIIDSIRSLQVILRLPYLPAAIIYIVGTTLLWPIGDLTLLITVWLFASTQGEK